MAGKLAIDFGTSNTVVACWDPVSQAGIPVSISGLSRRADDDVESGSVIPSLVHYAEDGRVWMGQQVVEHGLYDAAKTFRWMKHAIASRSPARIQIGSRALSHFDAGAEFLSAIVGFAAAETGVDSSEEIAFTAPVEAFEHYINWLGDVSQKAGFARYRILDEPSAAALGYGISIQDGDVYLVFDFGGGTLDVSMVRLEQSSGTGEGARCRVLGKAGTDLGGALIDQWIFQEVLGEHRRKDSEPEVRRVSRALLAEAERVKERLSTSDRAELSVMDPESGMILTTQFNRSRLENLFDSRGGFTRIHDTLRRAMNAARERGYSEDHIKAILMVGGSSQIPFVQRTLERFFGRDRVQLNRPLDAVARGGAAFVGGTDIFDHIQHDYGIRYVDPLKGGYEYKIIVKQGTAYPTAEPLAKLKIKATHDRQQQLGIAIFEIGEKRGTASSDPVALVFDPTGAARLLPVTAEAEERSRQFWVNEHSPTFLAADPPALRGEPRFEVQFSIDANKRLIISSRDLKSDRWVHRNYPVVKLV